MPSAGIFLIQDGGGLVRLSEQPYDSEALLQRLLAQYPEVLAGEEKGGKPKKWLLVKREMSVPASESGGGRWYLDHLFLDQDGIPTLVEVKRSTDTRLRREVVGQMLDYAANAVVYWPVERIESEFETTARADGSDPEQLLMEFLGTQTAEGYWQVVKTNLQAGKIRLVFVADEIPDELRRVVEFLNEQMDPAEVIAVEVRQFVGQGVRSLVPRIIGQTMEAQTRKTASGSAERWTAENFIARVQDAAGPAEADVVKRIIEWAERNSLRIWWGSSPNQPSFYPMLDFEGGNQYTFSAVHGKNGYVQFQFPQMRSPFDQPEALAELISRIEDASGVRFGENPKFPSIRLSALTEPGKLDRILRVADWIIEQTKRSSHEN